MFTGLTNTIINLFTPGGESGANAMEAGYPMAMFHVAGGPVITVTANGRNDQDRRVLDQFDVPTEGRGRKKAALAAINAHGYELAGPPLRVGNPAMYVAPVLRVRRPR
ncbi:MULTISPECIES: hypothetical protein [unclassified Gordonia (in: high G+C Gram-positive bacteria)]|uniref:hypothetical protein n=1 Tax=unclassified Gordonia (in: high G+C Gram-positive bacteria) TaxID=2657482 RepID=UPI00071C56E7|nr:MULTISPECIES: hypothetical protein [unclassified Gordonia (in: high G+C Gram-positive bacteria)]KSU54501.1 hypothetical protein AS181_21135 [Gordonia sp. SGD-V-85]WGJ88070.1 hypothetical protein QAD21_24510 [Gordonia sp. SMJS1]SCC53853.1 hypothetical protein GA0061091_12435 [Gordonia sp. v-85]